MMRRRRTCKRCLVISFLVIIVLFLAKCKMKSPEQMVRELCQSDAGQFLSDVNVSLGCDCDQFRFKSSSYVDSLLNGINSLGERHKNILYLRQVEAGREVVLKYRKDSTRSLRVRDLNHKKTDAEKETILKELMSGNEFNGQPHFCSHPAFNEMSSVLDGQPDNLLVANMNFEVILLKFLRTSGLPLPVPEYIANCGLYLMESYGGSTMDHFYKCSVERRMKIARNLLRGAKALTEGYRGFRIYLTDATKDNIAVDGETLEVTFIDLDDVIIQFNFEEEEDNKQAEPVHQHRKIECDNCFAYSTKDICGSQKSDINLFTVCQLLLEDLNGDHKRGFLFFEPEVLRNYSKMWRARFENLLKAFRDCVYCDSGPCPDRFQLVDVLVDELNFLVDDSK